jgi:hypothetical protein
VLQKRAQIAGKPSVCRRLATLELWSRAYNWQEEAARYDAECARRRARELAEQERQQLREDLTLLQQTLRGCVATAAVILSHYTNADGALVRPAELRDVGVLLKVALDGLCLVHPGGAAGAITGGDVEMALRQGTAQQRSRLLSALQDVQATVEQIQGRR